MFLFRSRSSRDAQTSKKAVAGVFVASGGPVAQCKVPSGKTVGRIGAVKKVRIPVLYLLSSQRPLFLMLCARNQRKMDALALVHHPWLTEWWDRFGCMSYLTLRCLPAHFSLCNGHKLWLQALENTVWGDELEILKSNCCNCLCGLLVKKISKPLKWHSCLWIEM